MILCVVHTVLRARWGHPNLQLYLWVGLKSIFFLCSSSLPLPLCPERNLPWHPVGIQGFFSPPRPFPWVPLCEIHFSVVKGWSSPRSACGRRHLNVEHLIVLARQNNPVISSWWFVVVHSAGGEHNHDGVCGTGVHFLVFLCLQTSQQLNSPFFFFVCYTHLFSIISREARSVLKIQDKAAHLKAPAHPHRWPAQGEAGWSDDGSHVRSEDFMHHVVPPWQVQQD